MSRMLQLTTHLTSRAAVLARDVRGVAAVEFALILPIMFMLFVGSIEFSQAITVDRRVTQIASSTADLIARTRSITTAEVDGIMDVIDQIMEPYDPALMKLTVTNVFSSTTDATDTKVCWSYNHNGGVNSYTAGAGFTLPTGIVEKGDSVVVAEVRYDYVPLIFSHFITSTLALTETFYLKPRLSSAIEYNGTQCL